MSDIRWKESLSDLGDALDRFGEVVRVPADTNDYVIDAAIQRFEFSIELFWKTIKHLLAVYGKEATLPLDVLRKAYSARWIDNEQIWISMMKDRNLTSHIYKQELAREIHKRLLTYYPKMRRVYEFLKEMSASL